VVTIATNYLFPLDDDWRDIWLRTHLHHLFNSPEARGSTGDLKRD